MEVRTSKRPFDVLESDSEESKVSALVRSTFKDAWLRFYEQNVEDTQKAIASLRASKTPRRRREYSVDAGFPPTSSSAKPAEEHISIRQFDENETVNRISWITVRTVEVSESASLSTPAYESCPPISRNIMVGDDPNALPFIPFADDPSYKWKNFAEQYAKSAWRHPWYMLDPGESFVTVRAVRHLMENHGLKAEEIENTGAPPAPLLDSKWRRGILYKDSLGDWFRKFEQTEFIPRALLAEKHPDVNLGLSLFCNRLNCLVSCCTTHFDEPPPPPNTTPTLTSSELMYDTLQPCDRQCFLHYQSSLPSNWTTEDLSALDAVLRFSPDTSPCDLAIICNKPCFEAFRWRRKMVNDEGIKKTAVSLRKQRILRASSLVFEDSDGKSFIPNPPCSHVGPCNEETGCDCFQNSAHCEHGCRCDSSCPRRWKGCRCYSGGRGGRGVCRTDICPCWKARRECDPEVCGRCKPRDPDSTRCRNVALQRGLKKMVEVKEGAWGLGCFVLETVVTDELILEYVGELIFEPTFLSRDDVASHRNRSYVFRLNRSLSIDAAYAGNEARYINHDLGRANCKALEKLVNGEHRIGIYAMRPLETGTELFLDYGPDFFKVDKAGGVAKGVENGAGEAEGPGMVDCIF